MPLYAVICRDKPGKLQTRLTNREKHLGHIAGSGIVTMAGPLIEEGEMRGSLVILDCMGIEDAQAWAEADPYNTAGLFESVSITEWNKIIG